MHSPRYYYVYIMTNRSRTLYAGITSNLAKRVFQHKKGVYAGFTSRYKIDRLIYYERFVSVQSAIAREKQIKGLLRLKKLALIVSMNPKWKDLSEGWYEQYRPGKCTDPSSEALHWRRAPLPQDDRIVIRAQKKERIAPPPDSFRGRELP